MLVINKLIEFSFSKMPVLDIFNYFIREISKQNMIYSNDSDDIQELSNPKMKNCRVLDELTNNILQNIKNEVFEYLNTLSSERTYTPSEYEKTEVTLDELIDISIKNNYKYTFNMLVEKNNIDFTDDYKVENYCRESIKHNNIDILRVIDENMSCNHFSKKCIFTMACNHGSEEIALEYSNYNVCNTCSSEINVLECALHTKKYEIIKLLLSKITDEIYKKELIVHMSKKASYKNGKLYYPNIEVFDELGIKY